MAETKSLILNKIPPIDFLKPKRKDLWCYHQVMTHDPPESPEYFSTSFPPPCTFVLRWSQSGCTSGAQRLNCLTYVQGTLSFFIYILAYSVYQYVFLNNNCFTFIVFYYLYLLGKWLIAIIFLTPPRCLLLIA